MLKVLAIIFLAVAFARAYDFKDTYFNQYLLEDYESLNSNILSRQRRDTAETSVDADDKGSHCGGSGGVAGHSGESKKDFTCCQATQSDPTYFATIKEAKKECALKIRTNNSDVDNFDPFNCELMERIKELIFCESECVAKSLGHLDEEGNFNRQDIELTFKKQFPEADEATLKQLDSYVDKCLEKIKALELKPENKCNRLPLEMHHCMFSEIVTGCPAELQTKSHRCDKIRESFSKGAIPSLGKHIFHEFLHHGKHHGHHGKE